MLPHYASVRGGSAGTRRHSRPAASLRAMGWARGCPLKRYQPRTQPIAKKSGGGTSLALNCNITLCSMLQISANEEPRLFVPTQPSPFKKPTQPHSLVCCGSGSWSWPRDLLAQLAKHATTPSSLPCDLLAQLTKHTTTRYRQPQSHCVMPLLYGDIGGGTSSRRAAIICRLRATVRHHSASV